MAAPRARRKPTTGSLPLLSLTALGVVYGDIGTNVLYAVRESFRFSHLAPTGTNVFGVVSLIVWSLVLVISVKYALLVLRADNRGEGGILALTALAAPAAEAGPRGHRVLLMLGLFGTALLYGDGILTPVVTVLSALEGLGVATPSLRPYVLPAAIALLLFLFVAQRYGAAGVGRVFGPVMLVWFLVIGVLGASWILREPRVLGALNPWYALRFFLGNGWKGFLVLGSVFLAVTGGEALYADLGQFGRRPIQLAWYVVVLPALTLNYLGQGALLLTRPEAVENPFYRIAPAGMVIPLVGIATLAAVIASQAMITGAFSLTMQAVQLGYLPRMTIRHTSARMIGQIYIPAINWLLLASCIGLALGFRSSGSLAAAYGVAVSTTMIITTLLMTVVERRRFRWGVGAIVASSAFFLLIDLAFWGANLLKVPRGGWFPLVVGAFVLTLMTTWKRGRQILASRLAEKALPWDLFEKDVESTSPRRVAGTAIFMCGSPTGAPPALLRSLKHYGVLHERVVLLHIDTIEIPYVSEGERSEVTDLGAGFFRLLLRYGYMERPRPAEDLARVSIGGVTLDPMEVSYFLGRQTLIPSQRPGMSRWRKRLMVLMVHNVPPMTSFFGLPPNRIIELGAEVEF